MTHAWAPIDATHSIPYAGGVANSGRKIYIDKRVPRFVHVGGKRIDAHEAISVHEGIEHHLMKKMGMRYPEAHRIATGGENAFVKEKYGINPHDYQRALQDGIDKARASGEDAPRDLDPQPYRDSGEMHLLQEPS